MLSTTDASRQRGQSLVIFALAVFVLLGIAALAFDLGQAQLDRRGEQNGADAAAIAAARYVVEPTCFADPSLANCSNAVNEAMRVAYQNGYGAGPTSASNGVVAGNGSRVKVQIPPGPESEFHGRAGYVEVQINRSRPSLFAGVLGIATQGSGALGTASNLTGVAANYSMMALDPHHCDAVKVTGSGTITIGGSIQVNSDCTHNPDAFDGGGSITVTVGAGGEIDVVGTANWPPGHVTPSPQTGQPVVPDPLADLPAPVVPALPAIVQQIGGPASPIPSGCPGGSGAATALAPATCSFPSSYANGGGTTWMLSPGYYPGGINVQGGTIFLKPGLYYIGGGGVNAAGTGANVYSVSGTWSGTTAPSCTPTSFADCGGVLIYNTNDPTATSGSTAVRNMGPITLNGADSIIHLYGIQNAGPYTNIVIFQDRSLPSSTPSGDLQLNGSGSNLYVQGTIYMPNGNVAVSGGGNLGPTQIIANSFAITGGGNLTVGFNQDVVAQLHAVGLVE